MSHFHFVLLDNYKKDYKRLGEESWRIKVIGMPSLNKKNILKNKIKKIQNNFDKFTKSNPFMLLTFHPVTLEIDQIEMQITSLIKAVKKK